MGQGGNLGVGVDGQIIGWIKLGHRPAGAHTAVGHPGGAETIFNHVGGFFAGRCHITIMQFPGHLEHVGLVCFVDKDGTLLHGFLGIKNARQRLIDDFNQAQCLFGRLEIGGGHSRYFIPVGAHLANFQWPVVLINTHFYLRNILSGDHRPHPRQSPGLGSIDFDDACMGKFAVKNFAVEHPGQFQILNILGATRCLINGIDFWNPFPNRTQTFHQYFSYSFKP